MQTESRVNFHNSQKQQNSVAWTSDADGDRF